MRKIEKNLNLEKKFAKIPGDAFYETLNLDL